MSPAVLLALPVACAAGAVGRYLLDRAVQSLHPSAFPWGTWVVNVLGSLALGAVAALADRGGLPRDLVLLVATGFLGSFTTFSTLAVATVHLLEEGRPGQAAANLVGSFAAGVPAAAAGAALVALL